MKFLLIFLVYILSSFSILAQNYMDFRSDTFPTELIAPEIIFKRGLTSKMDSLATCDWANRIGKKIDVFWVRTENGNLFGHSYEYFMDCDNVRLIYWSTSGDKIFPIVDFMIEDLEDESDFVVAKRKHLKNKKKYRKYLEGKAKGK